MDAATPRSRSSQLACCSACRRIGADSARPASLRRRGSNRLRERSCEAIMDARRRFSNLTAALVLLGMFTASMSLAAQQSGAPSTPPPDRLATRAFPDSPGTVRATSEQESNSIAALEQTQNKSVSESAPQNAASQQPVGTAAAEAPNVNAIAASQPAGVAIAPARQHRVRTIVLRTGAILGAVVAVGAVVALTAATPPKPPGAH